MDLRPSSAARPVLGALLSLALACTPAAGAPDTESETAGPTTSESSSTGGPTTDEATTGESESETTSGTGCQMVLDEDIAVDTTIPAGCVVLLDDDVTIHEEATLTLEPGVRVEATMGTSLDVGWQNESGGRLVAAGTAEAPIVFTSASASPTPGDWAGIQLKRETLAGTVFDHVVVEYAGAEDEGGGLRLQLRGDDTVPGRIAIDNSLFRHNIRGGVVMWATNTFGDDELEPDLFASFTGNSFTDSIDYALVLQANSVAQVDLSNSVDAPVLVLDSVFTDERSWADHGVPYVLSGELEIDGGSATLTLEGLEVHGLNGSIIRLKRGALIAKNVLFRSAKSTPLPGDWEGLRVGDSGSGTAQLLLEGSTISHANAVDDAVLVFSSTDDALLGTVRGTTFSDNVGDADIDARGECDKFTAADPANTFDLTPCI